MGLLLAACGAPPPGEVGAAPPITAVGDWVQVPEDGSVAVVLAVDGGAGGSFEILVPPASGSLTGTAPDLVYTPAPDFNGVDGLQFSVTVGNQVAEAAVVLDVLPVEDAPVGQADPVATAEDQPVSGTLSATDADGDALYFSIVTPPTQGSFAVDPWTGEYTFTPAPDWSGEDSVTWSASDGAASSGELTTALAASPVADVPVALPSTLAGVEDTVAFGALSGFDADGDPLTFAVVTGPTHGAVLVAPDGTFTWTPDADFAGSDQLVFSVSDGGATSASAIATLDLTPTADPPVADPAEWIAFEDTPLQQAVSASDPDGQALVYTLLEAPAHGEIALEPLTGVAAYTPAQDFNGLDFFSVLVSDGALLAVADVDVEVRAVEDAPVALPGEGYGPSGHDLLGTLRATDPDGDLVTFALDSAPAHGVVVLVGDAYTYTPDPSFVGPDAFGFTASDGAAVSLPALVALTVFVDNRPPTAEDADFDLVEDVPFVGPLVTADPDGDPLVSVITAQPAHGTATIDADGLHVVPDLDFVGMDVALYQVSDPSGLYALGQIVLRVAPDADADTVPDEADDCAYYDPDQTDVDADGIADGCDCLRDDFDAGSYDPTLWTGIAGDAAVSSAYARSGSYGLNLGGLSGEITTQPVDVSRCSGVEVEYWARRATSIPDLSAALTLAAWDGAQFGTATTLRGTTLSDSGWVRQDAWFPSALFPAGEASFRIASTGRVGLDDFFVDDVRVACDTDGDGLGDCIEPGWGTPTDDADFDDDGLDDGDEIRSATDPEVADSDADGVPDGSDHCPATSDPLQSDANGDGVGDACALELTETFATNALGPAWSGQTGDSGFSSVYAASPAWSFNLGGGIGSLALAPHTLAPGCPALAWSLALKRGPDAPEIGDNVRIELWDGAGWATVGYLAGRGTLDAAFLAAGGSVSTDTSLVGPGLQLRFVSNGLVNTDDFFLDDLYLGCDADLDGLADIAERKAYGTDDTLQDTDGDGVDDGAEILVGRTDPLDPAEF
jgi:hypothetical protein